MIKQILIGIMLFSLIITSMVYPACVEADVPKVLELIKETRESQTVLVISVRHNLPTSIHYIDTIDVEVDGELEKLKGLEPQKEVQFTVEFDILSGAENIRARAHCNVHGWSKWSSMEVEGLSDRIGIPGFPIEATVIGLILVLAYYWVSARMSSVRA